MTISQAVAMFGVNGVTDAKLRHWIKTNRITGYRNRFDGSLAVKASEIQKVLDSMNQFEPIQQEGDK